MALPVQPAAGGFRPELDENGVDWSAFAMEDFKRTLPEFDKLRYKADKLREERGNVLLLIDPVNRRLPTKAKNLVMKYLRADVIDVEHIVSEDLRALVRLERRAERLRKEIVELKKRGWERQQKACQKMFERWEA